MWQGFTIALREGIEAFLIVALILSYLKRTGRAHLARAVYLGTAVSIVTCSAAGLLFSKAANQSLWEGILALVAAVLVGSLLVYMKRVSSRLKGDIEARIESKTAGASEIAAFWGVFGFTLMMITREGMETALLDLDGALSAEVVDGSPRPRPRSRRRDRDRHRVVAARTRSRHQSAPERLGRLPSHLPRPAPALRRPRALRSPGAPRLAGHPRRDRDPGARRRDRTRARLRAGGDPDGVALGTLDQAPRTFARDRGSGRQLKPAVSCQLSVVSDHFLVSGRSPVSRGRSFVAALLRMTAGVHLRSSG